MTASNQPESFHPVALLELETSDKEYHFVDQTGRSPRFLIEEVDRRDRFAFTSRAAAEVFMSIHGMEPVSDQAMERLRGQAAK